MYFNSFKYLSFFMILTMLLSCGKTTEEILIDGLESASIHLSKRECQPAIDLLEGLGRQNRNHKYLKMLSSAYACRAEYSTTVFFGSDVGLTVSPAPLGGMTTYSTSLATVTSPLTTDTKFRDLQSAIDILAYAGGIGSTVEPTALERAKYFTANQAGDINTQLAFMVMVQLGKLMKVYSNASAAGVKGAGGAGNVCFTDYSDVAMPVPVQNYILNGASPTGACHVLSSPHSQLGLAVPVAERRKRMCEGVVLMNSFLDVLPSVLITAGGGDLEDLEGVTEDIDDLKDALILADASIGSTLTVLNQSNCETSGDIDENTLASYYAMIFEALVN